MLNNKLSHLISIQDNGQNFTEEEHTLKLHFRMSHIFLLVLIFTLSMLATVHYLADNMFYTITNAIGACISFLVILILQKITPKQFYTLAHIVFIIFIILILITFKYNTKTFPLTTWFLIYIMGVFFSFNHKIVLRYIFVFFIIFLYIVFNDAALKPYIYTAKFIFTAILGYAFIYFYEYRAKQLQERLIHINKYLEERIKEETKARTKILNQEKETLDFLAKHDYLTKIPNMFSLHQVLDKKCQNSHQKFALVYIDLKKFKNINDIYGHQVGNKVLEIIANRLQKTLPDHMVTRVGGDEFILLINTYTTEKNLEQKIQLCLSQIEQEITIGNTSLIVSASMGIAIFPDDHTDKEYLIKFADRAMKKSKKSLHSQYIFYTHENSILGYSKLQLELDLYSALQKDEFLLYYQPQFHTLKKEITGVEALLRWNHPKLGILTPNYFLDLAKEIGILKEIEKYVIHTALKAVVNWRNNNNYKGRVSINLSIQKLESNLFLDELEEALQLHQCNGSWVEFEILETEILSDIKKVQSILQKLKEKNIHIAIDDFGTGYASLSYLLFLDIHKIKIDKIFIDNLFNSSRTIAIIDAIITIASNFNYKLVVEGVETQKQLDLLTKHHCYTIQGYFYCRPIAEDKLETLLSNTCKSTITV